MTTKSPNKTRARNLQAQTGWSYQFCLAQVQTKTEAEIDGLVDARIAVDAADPEIQERKQHFALKEQKKLEGKSR